MRYGKVSSTADEGARRRRAGRDANRGAGAQPMPEPVTAKQVELGAGKPAGPQGDSSHFVPIPGKLLVRVPQFRIGHCCGLAFAMFGLGQQILKLDCLFDLWVAQHDGRMRPVPVGFLRSFSWPKN